MLLRVIFVSLFFIMVSISNCYAEKEYKATLTGCANPGGSDHLYTFGDGKDFYEIADEDIDGDTFTELWDKCNCNYGKQCTATFVYTTDPNDYRAAEASGLIRKFISIKGK